MKKFILPFLAMLISGYSMIAQEMEAPRKYVAYRTIDSIKIDGLANEDSWNKAAYSADFIDIEGIKTPEFRTNVKMLWDDEHLYFYAKMDEPHIWATLKQRDTVIFYNNDFEIFIDPDGDTCNYMEFEMNALNTVWDLFIVKPYREPSPIIDNWNFKGLKSAVHIEGTLNNPTDKDKFWSVEVAIPWTAMEEANVYGDGHENNFWRINFSRVNWDFELDDQTYSRRKDEKGQFLPEYNWVWSPQGVINMHEPEHWGYVFFSTEEVGNMIDFMIPEDEKIKWKLFELYRKQKSYKSKNEKWSEDLEELMDEQFMIREYKLKFDLENYSSGWIITAKSPLTGNLMSINEEGRFKSEK